MLFGLITRYFEHGPVFITKVWAGGEEHTDYNWKKTTNLYVDSNVAGQEIQFYTARAFITGFLTKEQPPLESNKRRPLLRTLLVRAPSHIRQRQPGSRFTTEFQRRTAVVQCLRCCATNRKVAGSIPTVVIGFFIDIKSFRSHYGPGVDSASKRNEYYEHFPGVKATGT